MPTAMKNRPSSKPLNGSMSVSSSRRYSLSASSTPARKAPSAIDRPTRLHQRCGGHHQQQRRRGEYLGRLCCARSSAAPGAAAAGRRARSRRSRRAPWPRRARRCRLAACRPAASSGSSARTGMAATSCNSITLSTPWPEVVAIRLRSASTDQADRGGRHSPGRAPATSASCQATPAITPAPNQQCCRSQELRAAPAEDRLAQRPQPPRFELEADQEQHQHDAELGEVQDLPAGR